VERITGIMPTSLSRRGRYRRRNESVTKLAVRQPVPHRSLPTRRPVVLARIRAPLIHHAPYLNRLRSYHFGVPPATTQGAVVAKHDDYRGSPRNRSNDQQPRVDAVVRTLAHPFGSHLTGSERERKINGFASDENETGGLQELCLFLGTNPS
jgi:hypothetical protein